MYILSVSVFFIEMDKGNSYNGFDLGQNRKKFQVEGDHERVSPWKLVKIKEGP